MSACGLSFRTAEDYRDHLPCKQCSPVEEANQKSRDRWISLYQEDRMPGRKTTVERALEKAHLQKLLEDAVPFVDAEAEALFGFAHEMSAFAWDLAAKMRAAGGMKPRKC